MKNETIIVIMNPISHIRIILLLLLLLLASSVGAIDTVPPTVTAYDVLDRPVKVTCPDGSVTETDYSVSGHVQVTTVTDALGNVSKTHVDGSGRTVKSIRFESPGSQDSILTQFTYDGIGRLVEVLDADSNVTVSD